MSTFPPRCFTCGKVISTKLEKYERLIKKHHPDLVLDALGFRRMCCRRMFKSYIPELDEALLLYEPATT